MQHAPSVDPADRERFSAIHFHLSVRLRLRDGEEREQTLHRTGRANEAGIHMAARSLVPRSFVGQISSRLVRFGEGWMDGWMDGWRLTVLTHAPRPSFVEIVCKGRQRGRD